MAAIFAGWCSCATSPDQWPAQICNGMRTASVPAAIRIWNRVGSEEWPRMTCQAPAAMITAAVVMKAASIMWT